MTPSEIAAEYNALLSVRENAMAVRGAWIVGGCGRRYDSLFHADFAIKQFERQHFPRLLRIAEAAAALLGAVDACDVASEPSLSHYERIKATHGTLRAAIEEDTNA